MAESGETLAENTIKPEDEIELDLAKCAAEFAQYCQVDVRNEVWYPSGLKLEKNLKDSRLQMWEPKKYMFFYFQSKGIEDTIEDMLVRLDEFSHLADTVTKKKIVILSDLPLLADLFVQSWYVSEIYAVR